MPGFEVFGKEEQQAINDLFELNGGILFAHGFDALRKGIYRVREFEGAFAKYMGSPAAQAVSSGSTALKVALKALGIGPGDEVITQAFTFIATIEAILEVGATPVIADIDDTYNLCPKSFENLISGRTKAVIPVHMLGCPSDMDAIMAVARRRNLKVIEDTAQAVGGSFKGRKLGTIGDAGTFSFDGGKTLTMGEGGMVLFQNPAYHPTARAVHDHGHEYSPRTPRGQEGALVRGFNYRITEIQGAIGLVQLSKLDGMIAAQRENKKKIVDVLKTLPVRLRRIPDPSGDAADTIVFSVDSAEKARRFVERMAASGLGTKNIPDALAWHFAGNWRHVFGEILPCPLCEDETPWRRSGELLDRSIALPVMIRMTDERIAEITAKLRVIAAEVL